jgi:hypothetical protein
MRQDEQKIEMAILQGWKVRLTILTLFITPAITVSGAYYNLKASIQESVAQAQEKTDHVYARKESVLSIKEDVRETKDDVKEIKNFLIRRGR